MRKELVKQRFSKSLKKYQENAFIQKQMAEKLVSLLEENNYDSILELGCGTGFVTEILNKNKQYCCYDAIDIVEGCQKYVKSISKEINFINTDIEKFVPERKYDLIISNAALQWLEDFPSFIAGLKNNLSENGILLFTIFGQKNFKELNFVIEQNLKYYSLEELKQILKDYEIKNLEEKVIIVNFDTPKEVLYHIKNTGVNALSKQRWTKSDLINFEKNYKKLNNGIINLTYNPIYIMCKK